MFYFLKTKNFRTHFLALACQIPHVELFVGGFFTLSLQQSNEVSFWVKCAQTAYIFFLGTSPKCVCCHRCAQVESMDNGKPELLE